MARRTRFTPALEVLERLRLLATIPMNVGKFTSIIVLDTTDPTRHTAWGFPGMQFNIEVDKPAQYMGIKQVTYDFSPSLLDPTKTTYNLTTGTWGLVSQRVAIPGGYSTGINEQTLALPKDPNITETISIDAQVWIYNPSGYPTAWDDLTDAMRIKSEAPAVTMFQVSDSSGAGIPASPFWFGTVSPQGINPARKILILDSVVAVQHTRCTCARSRWQFARAGSPASA